MSPSQGHAGEAVAAGAGMAGGALSAASRPMPKEAAPVRASAAKAQEALSPAASQTIHGLTPVAPAPAGLPRNAPARSSRADPGPDSQLRHRPWPPARPPPVHGHRCRSGPRQPAALSCRLAPYIYGHAPCCSATQPGWAPECLRWGLQKSSGVLHCCFCIDMKAILCPDPAPSASVG